MGHGLPPAVPRPGLFLQRRAVFDGQGNSNLTRWVELTDTSLGERSRRGAYAGAHAQTPLGVAHCTSPRASARWNGDAGACITAPSIDRGRGHAPRPSPASFFSALRTEPSFGFAADRAGEVGQPLLLVGEQRRRAARQRLRDRRLRWREQVVDRPVALLGVGDHRHLEAVPVELEGSTPIPNSNERGAAEWLPLPRTSTRRSLSSGSAPSSRLDRETALNWCEPAMSWRKVLALPLIGCSSPTAAIPCSPATRRSGISACADVLRVVDPAAVLAAADVVEELVEDDQPDPSRSTVDGEVVGAGAEVVEVLAVVERADGQGRRRRRGGAAPRPTRSRPRRR